MSTYPIDFDGVLSRWPEHHIHVISDASTRSDLTSDEIAARIEFVKMTAMALKTLISASEGDGGATIFAAQLLVELHGAMIGSAHVAPCDPCLERNLEPLMAAYFAGFSREVRVNEGRMADEPETVQ